jgi:hypothetical protein
MEAHLALNDRQIGDQHGFSSHQHHPEPNPFTVTVQNLVGGVN